MGLLFALIFGLIAGVIAKFLYPRGTDMGWIETMFLGLGGSFVGGWLASLLGVGGGGRAGIIGSVVGSLLILFIYERFVKHRF